jgi:hypothetical protein
VTDHGKQLPRRSNRWRNLLLACASFAVSLAVAEAAIRWFRIDDQLLTDTMMFVTLDPTVHQESSDWFLHYELKPNAEGTFSAPERPSYHVHVDRFGARYPTHPAEKAPGTFRILCVGGSTTYGAAVSDDETIPAALERRLNADAPPGVRFEAWNFGLHAYVLSQATHVARRELPLLSPDLILVQLHNVGPRCFILAPDGDRRDVLKRHVDDPYLMAEYFPPPRWMPEGLHFAVLRHCAIYRAITGLRLRSVRQHDDPKLFSYAEEVSQREAQALVHEADARGVPVVFYVLPCDGEAPPGGPAETGLPPDRIINLYLPDRGPEYYQIHPPPNGLDEFAERLIVLLRQKHWLPTPPVH